MAAPAHELMASLVAVIIATKVLGGLSQKIGQPAVLGELVAGILLGASVFALLDPSAPAIAALAEIGVIVLLFEIGLHTDLKALAAVGKTAATVALAGVFLPFVLGYFVATALGVATIPAVVCGAALTATSVGISARVLSDLGRLETPEGQVVLGAAVLDDIVGLVILAVVAGFAGGESPGPVRITMIAATALGFVVLAIALGRLLIPPLFGFLERVRISGVMPVIALGFAFAMAWLAGVAGSAPIVGAFAAGLVLHPTAQQKEIERGTTAIGHFFVPIFFASVGASVQLGALASGRPLLIGGVLIAVAIAGKIAAGFAPWWFAGSKLLVGVGMVPRGEVGLIFAQMGLAAGAIGADLFGALMLMVLVTTLVTPPALSAVGATLAPAPLGRRDEPGEGGIDDLVAGAQR